MRIFFFPIVIAIRDFIFIYWLKLNRIIYIYGERNNLRRGNPAWVPRHPVYQGRVKAFVVMSNAINFE